MKLFSNSKLAVGVNVSVKGCLYLCGPMMNCQLVHSVPCFHPWRIDPSDPQCPMLYPMHLCMSSSMSCSMIFCDR